MTEEQFYNKYVDYFTAGLDILTVVNYNTKTNEIEEVDCE